MLPDDLQYTAEHEWLRRQHGRPDDETTQTGDQPAVRVGITQFAAQAMGDIVFVTLPAVGADVTAGESLGEVESTKSVSDVYAPLSGTVTARNDALDDTPELVNSDPYGAGWLVEITPSAPAGQGAEQPLLSAPEYQALLP